MGKWKLFMTVLAMLLFCTLALFVAFRSTARAAPVFSDGFESDNFNAWTGTSGSPAIQSTTVHSGAFAANETGSSSSDIYEKGLDLSTCYARAYVYLTAFSSTIYNYNALFNVKTADGYTQLAEINIVTWSGPAAYWCLRYRDGGNWIDALSSVVPSLNTWYCVELKVVVGAGTGEVSVYLNGTELTELTKTGLTNNDAGNVDSLHLAFWLQSGNAGCCYYDDVAVDSSYIGPATTHVTFGQTGSAGDFTGTVVTVDGIDYDQAQLPLIFWWTTGSNHTFAYQSTLVVSPSEKQYVWNSTSGTLGETIQSDSILAGSSGTVIGNYETQYYVTFDQSGLDSTATGTVLSVGASSKVYGDLHYSQWIYNGTTYSYSAVISSSNSGQQFTLTGVAGLSSPISTFGTVTGNYKTQYYITFAQSGVGGDFSGNVMTVNGTDYGKGGVSFWADDTSVSTFSYYTPLTVGGDEQYVLTGVSGNTSATSLTVSAATTVTGSYMNQFQATFSYQVSGGGTGYSAPSVTYTVLGIPRYLTAGPTATVWVDNGSTYTYTTNPLTGSNASERWYASTGLSGKILSSSTIDPTYYHQYHVTFGYSTSDGSDIESGGVVGSYTQFGSKLSITSDGTGAVSPSSDWVDSGSGMVSYVTVAAGSGTERWALVSSPDTMSVSSSTTLSESDYYHQFQVTLEYSIANSPAGSPTDPTATFTVFGSSKTDSAKQSSAPTDWVDFGSSITYPNPITGAIGEQWKIATESSASPYTVIASVSSSTTANPTYYHQYLMTLSYSVSGGSGYSAPTFTADAFGVSAPQTLTTTATGYWFDVGSLWGVANPLSGSGSSERWQTSQSTSGTVSVQTIVFAYDHQYYLTVTTNFGSASPSSDWFDAGSVATIQAIAPSAGVGEQYVWNGWTGSGSGNYTGMDNPATNEVTMNGPISEAASWTEQWYIAVTSAHGSPTEVSQWVDDGAPFSVSVTNPDVIVAFEQQWDLTGLVVDSVPQTISNTVSYASVHASHSIEFDWTEQWYIAVTSAHGSPTKASQWVDNGSSFSVSVTNPDVVVALEHQWNLTGLSVDGAPQTLANFVSLSSVAANHAIIFSWTEQFYLIVETSPASVNSPIGEGWYDTGVTAHVSTAQYVDIVPGSSRYGFASWTGATGTFSGAWVIVDSAKTATANYVTQYYLTVDASPSSVNSPTGAGWYDSGTYASISTSQDVDIVSGSSRYDFRGWTTSNMSEIVDPSAVSTTVQMDNAKTVTANYVVQYKLTVASGHDSPVPSVGDHWLDNGTRVNASVSSPADESGGTRYRCTGYSGSGSVSSGSGTSAAFNITAPSTLTWNWITQYTLTMVSNFGTTSPSVGDDWFDAGSVVTISASAPSAGAGERYVWNGWTGSGSGNYTGMDNPAIDTVTMTDPISEVASWTHQFKLTMVARFGTTSPSVGDHWYDEGSVVPISASATNSSGERFLWVGWTGTGTINYTGSVNMSSMTMNGAVSEVASWTHQFYVTFAQSGVGGDFSGNVTLVDGVNCTSVGRSGWYYSGANVSVIYYSPLVVTPNGKQYVLTGISGNTSASVLTVLAPVTVSGSYKTQYYLTVVTSPLGINNPTGEGWYDVAIWAPISTPSDVSIASGSRHAFLGWATSNMSEIADSSANSTTVQMDGAKTVIADYVTQYQVSLVITPSGSGSIAPSGANIWENAGSLTIKAIASPGYVFLQWSSDIGSITFVDSSFPATTAMISGSGNIDATFATANATLTVRGMNDRIYYRAYDWPTSSWGDWSELPAGTTTDSPVTAICGGKQYFIVRGEDGYSLWFSWLNLTDSSFSGWAWMPGSTPSTPTLITNGTALILVVRGSDNTIYYRVYDVQTQNWTDWYGLAAGTTCDKVGAAILGDTLQLVVRGFSTTDVNINNTLWYATMNLTSNNFSGWTFLPGSTPSAPILSVWDSNRLCLVVRGSDNTLYIKTFNGTSWQDWTGLSSGSTLETPAATVTGDTLNIVVVGMDGITLWQTSVDLITNAFSDWIWITGSTPSPPILTS